ncbi:S1C family serine protease [Nakamurella panacisegetis]|nr:S1C family serine protease [Nakamurella panacisegetis]
MTRSAASTAAADGSVGTAHDSPPAVRPVSPSTGQSGTPIKTATTLVSTSATSVETTRSPSADFAAIYAKQQSGVVRIETVSCSSSGIGTGFLLSATLVATVDHVVTQSAVVSLITAAGRTTGTVIGTDPTRDLALIRADQPLTGYHFHFARTTPGVGDPVAAIGFPIGDPITLTHGDISGLDRTITVDGTTRMGLIETDTPINPGNSGGPLIAADGSVVGLVDALRTDANGIGYAVPASQASVADAQWASAPVPQPPADCQNPLGPSQQQQAVSPTTGADSAPDPRLAGIIQSLNTYFEGIDSGDYAAAYSVQAPDQQSSAGVVGFAAGLRTSYDSNIVILGARAVDATTVDVDLSFNSLQTPANGPDGDSCDNWTLTFVMIQTGDGRWLMDGAGPYHGRTHTPC